MNLFEYSRQKREKALADAEGGAVDTPPPPAPPPTGGLTMSQSDFFKQPAKSPEAEAKTQKALADMLRARKY